MRALVTGASGFIGSHLVERLRHENADVAVILRPDSKPWRIEPLLPELAIIRGNWSEPEAIARGVREFAPEVVYHMAWQGVENAHRNDLSQVDQNLSLTSRLIQISAEAGCKAWVGLGSQAEYGPANRQVDESSPLRPTTLYGVVKLCCGLLAEGLCRHMGLRFAWVRVFSTYGPRDNPSWLIPYLIRELTAGRKPALTKCEQKWDYLYVADAAEAIFRVGREPQAAGFFNLGSGTAVALREWVEQLRDMIDPQLPLGIGEVAYRPDQVMHLQADIARLSAATGWTPTTSARLGLAKTLAYFSKPE